MTRILERYTYTFHLEKSIECIRTNAEGRHPQRQLPIHFACKRMVEIVIAVLIRKLGFVLAVPIWLWGTAVQCLASASTEMLNTPLIWRWRGMLRGHALRLTSALRLTCTLRLTRNLRLARSLGLRSARRLRTRPIFAVIGPIATAYSGSSTRIPTRFIPVCTWPCSGSIANCITLERMVMAPTARSPP